LFILTIIPFSEYTTLFEIAEPVMGMLGELPGLRPKLYSPFAKALRAQHTFSSVTSVDIVK
jgi:hypothetical protein